MTLFNKLFQANVSYHRNRESANVKKLYKFLKENNSIVLFISCVIVQIKEKRSTYG